MSLKLEQVLGSLKKEKDPHPKDWKLIGFHGSPKMSADLNLIGIGMGLDKSKLLRKIVGDWVGDLDPVEFLISKVKELLALPESQSMGREVFKSKVKTFLADKKVPNEIIERVLKSL